MENGGILGFAHCSSQRVGEKTADRDADINCLCMATARRQGKVLYFETESLSWLPVSLNEPVLRDDTLRCIMQFR
jgi:hypothetical protein